MGYDTDSTSCHWSLVPGPWSHESTMTHAHSHASADQSLTLAIILNVLLTIGEVAAGIFSGSLALLSDATHNAGDVTGLIMTYAARRLGRRPPSPTYTYGLRRMEIFAALANGAFLLTVNTLIVWEAIHRFMEPRELNTPVMAVTGVIAAAINGFSVLLLFRHSKDDINLRGAFLHLLQDTLASVVVVIAAVTVWLGVGTWVDPAASILVSVIVLKGAFGIIREATGILLERAPRNLDLAEMEREIQEAFPALEIHHAHLWTLGPGETAFTCHVKVSDMRLADAQHLSGKLRKYLHDRFGVTHPTLELECLSCGNGDLLCPADAEHRPDKG